VSRLATFTLEDRLFGLEADRVRAILAPRPIVPVPLAPAEVAGLFALRGRVVTAIDLRRRLHVDDTRPAMHLVLADHDGTVSLLVDGVPDVVPFDAEQAGPAPPGLSGPARALVRGTYPVGDDVALLLDADRAVRL